MNDLFNNIAPNDTSIIPVEKLTKELAKIELKRLSQVISYNDKLYHGEDSPTISDADYDALRKRNNFIEKKYPDLIRKDSPSNNIGSPVSNKFKKVTHNVPMLSLANAFSTDDIEDFYKRIRNFLGLDDTQDIELFAEPKIDGLSFSARYENGIFVQGATRGDGQTGEDITANLAYILPNKLKGDFPNILEIRGEVYMSHLDFNNLNQLHEKSGDKIFANPRNAAAGSLRLLDAKITQSRNLKYFAYGYGQVTDDIADTQSSIINKYSEFGLSTNSNSTIINNIQQLVDYYNNLYSKRPYLEYDIDGIVYKVNSTDWQKRLGKVSRHPRWAIAHKFPAEQAKTILEKITIQVGRTGVLTPVAILTPINVGGVIVARATLHNQDEIDRKDIREGDIVTIQRAGDVIPQIVEVDLSQRPKNSSKFSIPNLCPVCSSQAIRIEEEAATKCTGGISCKAQAIEKLKHFVSKNAFDIEGLGQKQIETFWNDKIIKSAVDIFCLEEIDKNSLGSITNKEGWGKKSADNLFKAINDKKNISLDRFIFAIGINYVGQTTAKLLAIYYNNFDNWLKSMISAHNIESDAYQDLLNIDGIGHKVAKSLTMYFTNKDNLKEISDLSKLLNIIDVKAPTSTSVISEKTVVFTGTLVKLTRSEAKSQAENLGAKVSNSISKKTDYLVAGQSAGSKLTKAKELNINILTEDDWINLIK